MFSSAVAQVVILLYAVLLAAGGIAGCLKAGNRALLIAGFGGAAAIVEALGLSFWSPVLGLSIAAALAAGLCGFFVANYRHLLPSRRAFATSRIPSGLLALLSLLVMSHLIIAAIH